jgi:hypothetical protein
MDVAAWLAAIEEIEGIVFMPVDDEIGVKSVELPGQFSQTPRRPHHCSHRVQARRAHRYC